MNPKGFFNLLTAQMATNFHYFKFIATQWLTGDIILQPLAVQGLFINICALYWQRDGILTIDEINKRYKNPKELKELVNNFCKIKNNFIKIAFLDEQLIDANHISKVNSENGKKGGRPALNRNKANGLNSQSEKKQSRSKVEVEIKESRSKETTTDLLQPYEEINDAIFLAMKSFRPEVPDKIVERERYKFGIRYKNKSVTKDIKLIQTWSENINFTPKETRKNEFNETAKRNKEKYG